MGGLGGANYEYGEFLTISGTLTLVTVEHNYQNKQ